MHYITRLTQSYKSNLLLSDKTLLKQWRWINSLMWNSMCHQLQNLSYKTEYEKLCMKLSLLASNKGLRKTYSALEYLKHACLKYQNPRRSTCLNPYFLFLSKACRAKEASRAWRPAGLEKAGRPMLHRSEGAWLTTPLSEVSPPTSMNQATPTHPSPYSFTSSESQNQATNTWQL